MIRRLPGRVSRLLKESSRTAANQRAAADAAGAAIVLLDARGRIVTTTRAAAFVRRDAQLIDSLRRLDQGTAAGTTLTAADGTIYVATTQVIAADAAPFARIGPTLGVLLVPQRPRPTAADYAARYQLTPAEARLACDLVDGRSLAEAAAARGISITTARTHLKHLFWKTETSSQRALVALLLTDAHLPNSEDARRRRPGR